MRLALHLELRKDLLSHTIPRDIICELNGLESTLLAKGKRINESTECKYEEEINISSSKLYLNINYNIYEENRPKSIDVDFDVPNGDYCITIITTYLGFGKIKMKIEYYDPITNRLSSTEKIVSFV